MKLAKPHIDVGVMTSRIEPMLAFWQQEVGLPLEEVLPLGRRRRQHRHGLNGSVFKLNEVPAGLPAAPAGGLRRLQIAREGLSRPLDRVDPDGSQVRLVPPGHDGVAGIALDLAVRDLAAARRFYGEALQLEPRGDDRFACGGSLLCLHEDPDAQDDVPIEAPGYRYLTVQVFDCEGEHRGILSRGGREGAAPHRAGDVAVFSMVRDPDGNWIEISQRASLTGSLDPADSRGEAGAAVRADER